MRDRRDGGHGDLPRCPLRPALPGGTRWSGSEFAVGGQRAGRPRYPAVRAPHHFRVARAPPPAPFVLLAGIAWGQDTVITLEGEVPEGLAEIQSGESV